MTAIHGEFISWTQLLLPTIFSKFHGRFSHFSRKMTFYFNFSETIRVMDQRRLLTRGPHSAEGSTVGPRVLSFM